MDYSTQTTIQLRALARAECARRGVPSIWVAGGRRADLEAFLTGGVVPSAAVPMTAMPGAPAAGGSVADALATLLASAASGPLDTFRAEMQEELLSLRGRVESIPGGVAEAVREIETVKRQVDALGDLAKLAEEIKAVREAAGRTRFPVLAEAAAAPGGALAQLCTFYTPGQSNGGTVVCLAAPPSFGKSWAVRRLGESYDLFLEHPCTSDLDEASRFLGTVAPDGEGGFRTVDGSLTEAVRAAAAGRHVLLFLDECFRLAERVAESLLTFLVPRGDRYVLRTRHPEAGGGWETISCPVSNLHIVAATNLGQVPPLEAFWSRLHVIRLAWTSAGAAETAGQILRAYGIEDPGNAAAQVFARAVGESRALFAAGNLAAPVDFRLLERGCRHAPVSTGAGVLAWCRAALPGQCVAWHPDTGDDRAESLAAVKTLQGILSV